MASARALAAVLAGAPAGGLVSGGGSGPAVPGKAAPRISAATLGVFGASAAGWCCGLLRRPGSRRSRNGAAAERMAGFPEQARTVRRPRRDHDGGEHRAPAPAAARPRSCCTACPASARPPARWNWPTCARTSSAPPHSGGRLREAIPTWSCGAWPMRCASSWANPRAGFASPPRWGRRRWNTYARRLRENMRGQPRPRRRRQPRGTPQPGRQLARFAMGSDFRRAGRARWRVPAGSR